MRRPAASGVASYVRASSCLQFLRRSATTRPGYPSVARSSAFSKRNRGSSVPIPAVRPTSRTDGPGDSDHSPTREKPAFGHGRAKFRETWTLRWRELDSNSQSPQQTTLSRSLFSPIPAFLLRPENSNSFTGRGRAVRIPFAQPTVGFWLCVQVGISACRAVVPELLKAADSAGSKSAQLP